MTAPRLRWPTQVAIQSAVAAVQANGGTVFEVRIHADGGFSLITDERLARIDSDERDETIEEKLRRMAG